VLSRELRFAMSWLCSPERLHGKAESIWLLAKHRLSDSVGGVSRFTSTRGARRLHVHSVWRTTNSECPL